MSAGEMVVLIILVLPAICAVLLAMGGLAEAIRRIARIR